jgi:hypothetical protein
MATRSLQNHAAYKRRCGRAGSETTPYILPIIPRMAKQGVHDSLLFRVAFHQPHVYGPTPFTWDGLLSSHSAVRFSQGDLDILHGLYQRMELDSLNARINQFKHGNLFYLRKDTNYEMRAAVRRWNGCWKKMCCNRDPEYDDGMDLVHLQWTARLVEHLREELYLLSTKDRTSQYLTTLNLRQVETSKLS